jgi:hypothetical protein
MIHGICHSCYWHHNLHRRTWSQKESLADILTHDRKLQNTDQTWIRTRLDATKLWSVCDQSVRHLLIARASLLRLAPFMRMLLTNGVQSIRALKRFSVAVCFFEDTFSDQSISQWIAFFSLWRRWVEQVFFLLHVRFAARILYLA